jgi:hypothetical protein
MTTRLTPEEQAAIENAIADAQVEAQLREIEEEAAERARLEAIRRGLGTYVLGPADSHADPAARQPDDVANAMRGERALPDMLHPNWLVRGVLHWIYSDAEAGKTWLALKLALNVMRAGGVVLWSDEELGVKTIADRLLDLGATPEEIEDRLIYLAFSDWTMSEEDRVSWNTLLAVAKPDLVVFDTATDHLVSAGLDEDKGGPVTAWVRAPARRSHRRAWRLKGRILQALCKLLPSERCRRMPNRCSAKRRSPLSEPFQRHDAAHADTPARPVTPEVAGSTAGVCLSRHSGKRLWSKGGCDD